MTERVTSTIGKYPEDPVWHKYFMGIALLSAKRSKDGNRQVGACVVDDKPRILGIGYNGMPLNCSDLDTWGENGECPYGSENERDKHYFVCHAELNAIVNRNPKSVKGSTMYATLFPCNHCAMIIIKSGIKRVVYLSDDKREKPSFKDGRKMLQAAREIETVSYTKLMEKSIVGEKTMEYIQFYEGNSESGTHATQSMSDTPSGRQHNEIFWEHYFMALALWSGQFRGEDATSAKEGACIVNEDKRIVGLGYVENFEADGAVYRSHCVMHAPVNAIVNQSPTSLKGCALYTIRYPCNECAKMIVQSGIKRVIYLRDEKMCQNEMLKIKLTAELQDERLVDQEMEQKKSATRKIFA